MFIDKKLYISRARRLNRVGISGLRLNNSIFFELHKNVKIGLGNLTSPKPCLSEKINKNHKTPGLPSMAKAIFLKNHHPNHFS